MTSPSDAQPTDPRAAAASVRLTVLDGLLLLAFLTLVFLLGVFPLKDVDFWWHLRTGDWIRAHRAVPTRDLFTYTVPDHRWIDLHWLFQVLLSLGYESGGVVLLNLAKCVVTTLALLLLISARRRDWPIWVMVLAWIPALVLLGGRMYIRPETLTLLYLSIFLAVLPRLAARPWLVMLLPPTLICWVNSQGLFILGPVVLVMALLDYSLAPTQIEGDRRRWWRIVLAGTGLTALACFANPHGARGAFFPLSLFFGTMADPIFKNSIAELSSISKLIADTAGYPLFMLQVHLAVVLLGGLSFVLPCAWVAWTRALGKSPPPADSTPPPAKGKAAKRKKANARAEPARTRRVGWRLSLFRLLLFGAFTALGWQATRNSHQFAAVVGTLTAWNLGEWAAAIHERRASRSPAPRQHPWPRLLTLGVVSGMLILVGSGTLYDWAEEGRTVGLGEEPAWFPHQAVEFAGQPSFPPRFLSLHIGHAALFLHDFGPERKVFVDPRLEVMGPDLYRRYIEIQESLSADTNDWRGRLEQAQRPVVLIDHLYFAPAGVTLLADTRWKCVWFGPVAAVFAHEDAARAAGVAPVDFIARHYGTQPVDRAGDGPEALSAAKGLSNYALRLIQERGRADLARPLTLLGLDYARQARDLLPGSGEPWAIAAALELARGDSLSRSSQPRFRESFDPALDLGSARVASFARRAIELNPEDSLTLTSLAGQFLTGSMEEAALPYLEKLASKRPRTIRQAAATERFRAELDEVRRRLGRAPPIDVSNGSQVLRGVDSLLATGRAESAARLLEAEYPPGERTWPVADRIATLRLHLGQPAEARAAWSSVPEPPQPALQAARIAATHYAEDDLDEARARYEEAIAREPSLIEAWFGLALVEIDSGRALQAAAALSRALDLAPTEDSRRRIQRLRELIPPATANTPPNG